MLVNGKLPVNLQTWSYLYFVMPKQKVKFVAIEHDEKDYKTGEVNLRNNGSSFTETH